MYDKPTDLYRHFDSDGVLLYVGVSLNSLVRLTQHKQNSHWADDIATITIEKFKTRAEALGAETKAIAEEGPLHNKMDVPHKSVSELFSELIVSLGDNVHADKVVPELRRQIVEIQDSLDVSDQSIERLSKLLDGLSDEE